MKKMPSKDFFSVYLSYDAESGVLMWKDRSPEMFKLERDCRAWNKKFAGKEAGSIVRGARVPRKNIVINRRFYLYHRVCMIMSGVTPEQMLGKLVDHIDHNPLNNKIENLRLVTTRGNTKNKSMHKNNSSGVCGVSFNGGRWVSYIGSPDRGERNYFQDKFEAICNRKSLELKFNYHPNHGKND